MVNCDFEKFIDTRLKKRPYADLSGQRFGKLTVLYRSTDEVMSNNNRTPRYACQCDCGNYILARATSLKNGHTKSCRCATKESMIGKNLIDLTGQRFNRWTVMYRSIDAVEPSGKSVAVWHCMCDCGVERDVRGSSLRGGSTFSCGCFKHEQLTVIRDLVGQTFGDWIVIEKAPNYISSKNGRWAYAWLCECVCGTKRAVTEQSLVTNKSTTCGCSIISSLEVNVALYLDTYDIKYDMYKRFMDLRGSNDGLLSYDFVLYDDDNEIMSLIECQGKQHYESIEFFGGEATFIKQKDHDNRKRIYAINNNIPLLEIMYTSDTYDLISSELNIFFNNRIVQLSKNIL